MNEMRRDPIRPSGEATLPRILVVEDEADLALLLTYNLEAEGYVAEAVERGDEAELRLVETPPDLLFWIGCCRAFPGLEICRRLRARETTRTLPVIMLTARGEEVERVRGLSVGADDYVVKPFSVPELMARVRALLDAAGLSGSPSVSRRETSISTGRPAGAPRFPRRSSRPDRIPFARISAGAARTRFFARSIAGWGLGTVGRDRRANRRRPRRPAAKGAVAWPRARPNPHRSRNRLFV